MKFAELKNAFFELKKVENQLNMPLAKPQKQKLLKQKEKYCEILKKYNSLFLVLGKTLKDRLNEYFKAKNTNADIGFSYTTRTYTTECFEGTDTYTNYYPYMEIDIDDDVYGYRVNIEVETKSRQAQYAYDLDLIVGDFKTNLLDILNGFYDKEALGELYENYDDILDVLWDIVLQNIKALNQEKIQKLNDQQQEKHNLIVELTDQKIIAQKVGKLESEIAALEQEKSNYSDTEIDNIVID